MGKLNIFEISFNNGIDVFYSGNIIQGHVTVELTEPMKMRGISLKFEGKAHVHWNETQSRGSGKTSHVANRHYSADERYFNKDIVLFGMGPGQGSGTNELPAGRHTYPFQFQLRPYLPSSFEARTGHVRYTVSSTIDRPWKFDHKTKRVFTVISVLDLNQQRNATARPRERNQKHLCCLCCKSGPIEATFHLDRKGYVPGEAVKLYAEISNGTSRRIAKSYVDLKMVTTFRATVKSKTTVSEVARVTRPGIAGHSEDSWTGEELIIPPLPPSFLKGCNIIDIHYILQLNVDPSGPAIDLHVPIEIFIGTIPLRSVVEQNPPMPPPGYNMFSGETAATNLPAQVLYPLPPSSDLPDLPPPSYNECITGRYKMFEEGDDKHTRGNTEYAPVYTYYNWGHTPGALPPQSKNADD